MSIKSRISSNMKETRADCRRRHSAQLDKQTSDAATQHSTAQLTHDIQRLKHLLVSSVPAIYMYDLQIDEHRISCM